MEVDLSEAADLGWRQLTRFALHAIIMHDLTPFEGHDIGQMPMHRIHSASLVRNDASTPFGVRVLKSPSNTRTEFYAVYSKELKVSYREYAKGALGDEDTSILFVFVYLRIRCLRPSPPSAI
jgi:hypothetical protein